MKKILLYLFCFLAIQFLATYLVVIPWLLAEGHTWSHIISMLVSNQMPLSVPMVLVFTALYSLLVLALFLWRRWAEVSPNYLRTRPWAVMVWSVIAALGTLIPSTWLQEQMPDLPDMMAELFNELMQSPWGYVVLCILAPLVEEVVFRGAILRTLLVRFRERGTWLPIALSALLFSLVHANPAQMPHAFLIGLLLGWMYARTGSLLPGLALHWVNNTAAYVLTRLYPQAADLQLHDVFGSDSRVLLAVCFSLLILLPALYQLHLNMKRP